MTVWVVTYFYPEGAYAGIIGVYDSELKAADAIHKARTRDYPDCIFVTTEGSVE
jgi:hypothetical protein